MRADDGAGYAEAGWQRTVDRRALLCTCAPRHPVADAAFAVLDPHRSFVVRVAWLADELQSTGGLQVGHDVGAVVLAEAGDVMVVDGSRRAANAIDRKRRRNRAAAVCPAGTDRPFRLM